MYITPWSGVGKSVWDWVCVQCDKAWPNAAIVCKLCWGPKCDLAHHNRSIRCPATIYNLQRQTQIDAQWMVIKGERTAELEAALTRTSRDEQDAGHKWLPKWVTRDRPFLRRHGALMSIAVQYESQALAKALINAVPHSTLFEQNEFGQHWIEQLARPSIRRHTSSASFSTSQSSDDKARSDLKSKSGHVAPVPPASVAKSTPDEARPCWSSDPVTEPPAPKPIVIQKRPLCNMLMISKSQYFPVKWHAVLNDIDQRWMRAVVRLLIVCGRRCVQSPLYRLPDPLLGKVLMYLRGFTQRDMSAALTTTWLKIPKAVVVPNMRRANSADEKAAVLAALPTDRMHHQSQQRQQHLTLLPCDWPQCGQWVDAAEYTDHTTAHQVARSMSTPFVRS